jgi:pyridinium-3,5-bisthiocarboxylic acid mononucleotide nickel chelatase
LLEIHNHDEKTDHHSHHRNFDDIRNLIESSELSESVRQTSVRIFEKLATAEANVHGISIQEVHFHEVGAADSILDIVGAAIGLEYFNIQTVYSSSIPLGSGRVMTHHGLLPLPAPATLELIQVANIQVSPSSATVELVTPTGAAILATLAIFQQPAMNIKTIGIGAGQRDFEWPNILRLMIGEEESTPHTFIEIETNIDDMNPQIYGYVMDKLFQMGALDVYLTPIIMKKNRPATRLSIIGREEDESKLTDVILHETSTLGVRVSKIHRHEADRETRMIDTIFGKIPVKVKILNGKIVQATPEFDDCVKIAVVKEVPLTKVMREASVAAQKIIE